MILRCGHLKPFRRRLAQRNNQLAFYPRNPSNKICIGRCCKASNGTVLYISSVWPEPSSSAAGVRTAALIDALQSHDWAIFYLSTSKPNEHTDHLQSQGCRVLYCSPNREAAFAEALALAKPAICIFDRFTAEEAFSFRVRELVPSALRVLDLQDLHSLRRGRGEMLQKTGVWSHLDCYAPADSQDLLRELASIHRSDLALVCSPFELQLLTRKYQVPKSKLQLAPFFVNGAAGQTGKHKPFAERIHLMTIGNLRWLAEELWPLMRERLPPGTELHNYGAYGDSISVRQLHKPTGGFHIKGKAGSLDIMENYKLCLAPLRFGAGLKGKIVDSWSKGLPVVTTPIGSEGMTDTDSAEPWGGAKDARSASELVEDTARLYTCNSSWNEASSAGQRLLAKLYDAKLTMPPVMNAIERCLDNKEDIRAANLTGQMLWMQTNRATEYFSRWIELKERLKPMKQ